MIPLIVSTSVKSDITVAPPPPDEFTIVGVPLTPMYKLPVSVAYNNSPSAGLAGKFACKPLLICNAIC